jgi:hypothetical protein
MRRPEKLVLSEAEGLSLLAPPEENPVSEKVKPPRDG